MILTPTVPTNSRTASEALSIDDDRAAAAESAVQWRRLTSTFWVGRLDDRFVGSIEHGRRYTATDADGVVRGAYPRFDDAQTALLAPFAERHDAPSEAPHRPPAESSPVVVAASAWGAVAIVLAVLALTLL